MNKSTSIILGAVVVVAVLAGGWFFMNYNKYAPETYVTDTPTGSITTNTATGTTSTSTPTYAMSDVTTHKDATSCYTAISGSVYDLTMWVNLHPGGSKGILGICGTDGTTKFMNQHHGAAQQMTILARYKIGVLQ